MIERALKLSAARLDSALFSGDTARLSTLLATDAYFLGPAGDSARGAAAILDAVSRLRDSSAVRVTVLLDRRRREACIGGGWDEGIYSVQRVASTGDRETTSGGTYLVVWRLASDGHALVGLLALSPEGMEGLRKRAQCATLTTKRYEKGRLFATVSLFGLASTNTATQANATLSARGWIASATTPEVTQVRTSDARPLISGASARLRVAHGVSVEFERRFAPVQGLVTGVNTPDHEYNAGYAERMSSIIISAERRFVRAGFGIASIETRWNEHTFTAQYLQESAVYFQTPGVPILSRNVVEVPSSQRTTAIGPAALLALAVPLSDLTFFEARLQAHRDMSSTIRAVPGYAPWTAHFDGATFSIGLGAFF